MPRSLAALALLVVLSTACAHDVHTRFPADPSMSTGRIALVFTDVASPVNVVVNGLLLVRGARTEKVVVADVPVGFAEVSIAAGPGEKQLKVWVDADRETTVPLGSSGEAPLSALRGFALSMATVVVYALLR